MIVPGHHADAVARATQTLQAGGLLGLPTETVYGLAADATNARAVQAIFSTKGRPSDHPLIVHVVNVQAANRFAQHIPEFAQRLMQAFWPGPLTLILPRRPEQAAVAAGGQDTVGLRCPSHPVAQAVLAACAEQGIWGLAAPSANRFGRVSPTTAQHVQAELGPDLLILDGGPCSVGIESCIVDCTRGAPVLLRPGTLTPQALQLACGCKVLSAADLHAVDQPSPRASGTLESHYAPSAQVRLMAASALQDAVALMDAELRLTRRSQARLAVYSRCPVQTSSAAIIQRHMPDNADDAAQELFAALRDLDELGVGLIWVETPPSTPEWDGVRDRLMRAAAHR